MKQNELNLNQRRKKFTHMMLVLVSILICSMFFGCSNITDNDDNSSEIDFDATENWLSLPSISKEVDVFYVYPTISHNLSGSMDITDAGERALAEGILAAQASVFELSANIFAPFYRQMSTGVDMTGHELATDTEEFIQGADDVEDAFEYYIQNLNVDRPFFIASHSQGTMALIELIKNRFGNDEALRNRLIVAYLIGYTVTDADLSSAGLTAAQNATDIGVVVTYNTQSTTSIGGPMLMDGALCINPLNWLTDNTHADSLQNMGAVFFNDSTGELVREVQHYCDAQINIETGALTTTIPSGEELEIGPFPEGVYHRYDYALWYRNLQANVADRINAYFSEK